MVDCKILDKGLLELLGHRPAVRENFATPDLAKVGDRFLKTGEVRLGDIYRSLGFFRFMH